jgi:hypothetical protein
LYQGEKFATLHLMNTTIATGQTKTSTDVHLLHKTLVSKNQENIVILMQTDAVEDAIPDLHREMLEIINQSLVLTDGETNTRLDSCLKEMNGLIKGFLLSGSIKDIQAIVCIVDQRNMLHISHAGRSEAYVVRGNTANQITEYAKGKSVPSFVHIASGQLEMEDVVVVSTQRLLRSITPAQLVKISLHAKNTLPELIQTLEFEHEAAALATIEIAGEISTKNTATEAPIVAEASNTREAAPTSAPAVKDIQSESSILDSAWKNVYNRIQKTSLALSKNNKSPFSKVAQWFRNTFILKRTNGKNMHLLLIAGAISIFLIVWLAVNVSSFAKRSQIKAELGTIIEEINEDIRNAENRKLTGDKQAAIAILDRAEEQAKKVANDDSQIYRKEALDLLYSIQAKREDVSNIVRRSPIVAAELTEKNPDIQATGMIGLGNEKFIVNDKQSAYRVISNITEDGKVLSESELVITGTNFPRYKSQIFSITGNGMLEFVDNKAVSVKTDDTNGWINAVDMETYQRFLYLLAPQNNQIYKYERLSDRYGVPLEYNVNGALEDALDMSIDVFVYILKKDGTIIKLLSGETKNFAITQAPSDILKNATKIYKVPDGKLYALDPVGKKVIVLEIDATTGDATYLKQFAFDGDQIGSLHSLYVDEEESWLYIADEKRVFKIELSAQR